MKASLKFAIACTIFMAVLMLSSIPPYLLFTHGLRGAGILSLLLPFFVLCLIIAAVGEALNS
jgi:hypothetical protein